MNDNKISEALLVAYADGELGLEDSATVEVAIRNNPYLKARLDKYKKTGNILKTSMDIKNKSTPDHIIHRYREIESAINRKRNATSRNDSKVSFISWRLLSFMGGSYAAGLACAIFFITPGLMTAQKDAPFYTNDNYSDQIVMRGADKFETPFIQQGGLEIKNGGKIREGLFTLIFKSPVSGEYSINEISKKCKYEEVDVISQDCSDLYSGNVGEGKIIRHQFEIDDQDKLLLLVTISNASVKIEHNLKLMVIRQ